MKRPSLRFAVVIVVIMGLLAIGGSVIASHQFTDVPNSSPFHGAIDWLVDHGITAGCDTTPPRYCPKSSVTREQMAVFMNKLHDITPQLGVASGTSAQNITLTTYTAVTGASVTLTVPPGSPGRLLATFSAESYCDDPDWCTLRILVDGVEASPVAGTDFAFDSGQGTNDGLGASIDGWESHSVQRTATVAPGNHTVTVEGRVITGGAGKEFRLDDWLLSVQQYVD